MSLVEDDAKPADSKPTRGSANPPLRPLKPRPGARPGPRKPPAGRKPRRKALGARIAQSEPSQRLVAGLMRFLFKWARYAGRERASRIAGRIARTIAPLARENRVGRANLAAAFPEKSEAERERILAGVWQNLACTTIEYPYLQDLVAAFDPDRPTGGLIEHVGIEHAYALRDGGRPGVIFGAHLGNWELTAAIGTKIGIPVTALYRPPANRFVAAEMERLRGEFIGSLVVSGRGAAMRVASALQKGSHIGIVADQRINDGPQIPFFGRPAASNPVIGMMARLFDCPVHGAYTIRLPDGRYFLTMTPALDLPRDARGRVDAEATNVMVHGMIEGWVRAAPEQWLWLHDRWRIRKRFRRPAQKPRRPAA